MIFINPPFSNYFSFDKTISIKGSYTLEPRTGLIMQVLRTLRYSFEHNGWINKIGLRNPGIDYAIKNYKKNSIISVAILNKEDIPKLVKKIPDDMNIELNISCPNAEKKMITEGIENFLNKKRTWCIIKLSPTTDMKLVDNYYKQGFRQFHCSNTYPTPTGGLSGKFLIPYSTKLINNIKSKYSDTTVIGGGGITSKEEIEIYKKAGADHFSVSTLFFNPYKFYKFYNSFIRS
jgi:dihydroorotate dehydrogenase|tara:strand:+ start:252 stop:950 length:699 start_codon:yes stop_codon:yes gene_type:complete